MEITVKDRQTLLDVAIMSLGSAAGAFAFVRNNGISLTARMAEGQVLTYDAADIIATTIRDAYDVRGLSPATDIDSKDYRTLLLATGTAVKRFSDTQANIPTDLQPLGTIQVDPLEEALADAIAGRPPKKNEQIHLTRIFQNPFDDTFA